MKVLIGCTGSVATVKIPEIVLIISKFAEVICFEKIYIIYIIKLVLTPHNRIKGTLNSE